jgi:hypothetical protein
MYKAHNSPLYKVLMTVHNNISVQQDQKDAQGLYMFQKFFCSSSGGNVCIAIGIFLCLIRQLAASRVRVPPDDKQKSA